MRDGRLTPDKALLARFALEGMLSAAPSASGRQIDALRNGTQPNRDGWRGDALEKRRQQYADMVLLCRDLNQEEMRVCRLRYGCTAGIENYEALRSEWEIDDAQRYDAEIPLPGRLGQVAGNPHLRKVVGIRARLPDFQQIAEALSRSVIIPAGTLKAGQTIALPGPEAVPHDPITARQVKRLLESARSKVAWQIKVRNFNDSIEGRYE